MSTFHFKYTISLQHFGPFHYQKLLHLLNLTFRFPILSIASHFSSFFSFCCSYYTCTLMASRPPLIPCHYFLFYVAQILSSIIFVFLLISSNFYPLIFYSQLLSKFHLLNQSNLSAFGTSITSLLGKVTSIYSRITWYFPNFLNLNCSFHTTQQTYCISVIYFFCLFHSKLMLSFSEYDPSPAS